MVRSALSAASAAGPVVVAGESLDAVAVAGVPYGAVLQSDGDPPRVEPRVRQHEHPYPKGGQQPPRIDEFAVEFGAD